MSQLKGMLQEAVDQRLNTGGVVSTRLTTQLRAHRKKQLVIFIVLEAFLLVALLFCVFFLLNNPSRTSELKLLTGVFGIGAGGALEVIRRVWKEWTQTDLLLLLLEGAPEAQVTSVVDRLVKKL
jgi:hypothetical protein